MSDKLKVIWAETGMPGYVCEPCEVYTTKYHHDDTVTALQAKVARLEAVLMDVAEPSSCPSYGDPGAIRDYARNALRAIALDTTTATCDNTREGE